MYKLLVNFLLIAIFVFLAPSIVAAEDVTPDSLNDFDQYAQKLISKWQVPGMAVVVVKDGKPIYKQGYGIRDVKTDEKVDTETLFCLGSTTKAFNGTLLAILDEKNIIDLDKPIKDVYPEFEIGEDYRTNHLTFRDLLLHRSGFPGYDAVWYRSDLSSDELLDRLKYLKPNKGIREYWQYSNILFSSTGYIGAKVAGERWEDLVKENILLPLDMKKTGFSADAIQKESNYACPHKIKDDKIVKIPFLNTDPILPAGGMYSNANELGNWLIMNLNDGKYKDKEIISSSMLKQVHTPQMAMLSPRSFKETGYSEYALGWGYFPYRDELLIVHEGEIDGFKSHVSFIPSKNVGLAILCNSNTLLPSAIAFDIYDRILGKEYIDWNKRFEEIAKKSKEADKKVTKSQKKPNKKKTKPSHPLKDYAGKYFNPLFGEMIISFDDNKLSGFFREPFNIKHYQYDVFQSYDAEDADSSDLKMNFYLDKEGNIEKVGLGLVPELDEDVFFEKVEDAK